MSVKEKYQPVLNMGEKMNVKDGYVEESGSKLRVGGTVNTLREKDLMWDEIKRIGGENPSDIEADIKVSNHQYYAKHTVKSGESLSKIAKAYYGKPMEYKRIFEANTDQLKDPDKIFPGQELTIPFPEGRSAQN
ncbi:LysM peptidoglycan-binding domain-containing protein [Cryomorpha ignava]|uniref:LysM peptidoglycan-binding domain-containing protein n=1 Tax=Cryomorpha ignava TaxID=101383 RepID=A0A7K3WVK5_9FLAO|nr:LysM peptidoglycan-binding domain-containing protein [Cryomorpha ignava]NEN24635.1 LysM peptidoglycan-binding domain-containing protein [Cryomorpha ignava]